jgi:hypothetical protein
MIPMASTGTALVVSDLEGGITQGVSGAAEQGCYYRLLAKVVGKEQRWKTRPRAG